MPTHEIEAMLRDVNEEGQFTLTSLTDTDGFALITIRTPVCCDPEIYAAVAARVQRAARQTLAPLEMDPLDEVTVAYQDGQRLVCRLFEANGQHLILSVLVPKNRPYRRLTNRAISAIEREWRV